MFWRKRKARRADPHPVWETALSEIMRTWSVDNADVTPTEAGFDWLPGSHLVHVRIHEDEREPRGPVRFRITIATEFLRGVPAHDKDFVRQASIASHMFYPTCSLVYPPGEMVKAYFNGRPADAELFSSAYVYDDTVKWTSGFLARMSIIQPASAEVLSRGQELVGCGTPALYTGSLRPTVNGILNIVEDLIAPEGESPSYWDGSAEFEAFTEKYGGSDACFGFGDKQGMTFETPFGQTSALITFKTNELDLRLGAGLLVQIQISTEFDFDEACEKTAWLNYLESLLWTDFPQLGRWHALPVSEPQIDLSDAPKTVLAHTCFVPNAFFLEGLVTSYALWAITRVRWTREQLLPDEKDLTMLEILEARRP